MDRNQAFRGGTGGGFVGVGGVVGLLQGKKKITTLSTVAAIPYPEDVFSTN